MSRLLLLITTRSYKAGAFMAAAERLGVDLVVGTERPQATAGLNPAGHLTLAFADPGRAVARIVERAAETPVDAVLAADDEGAVLAALTAEALGLTHSPAAAVRAARDKLLTRRALTAAGLPTPWFESFRLDEGPAAAAPRVRYPCVVKPRSLAASRGVMRADDGDKLAAAWRRLEAIVGRRGEVLVEGFIPGFEVALEGILTRGRLKVLALFDKPDPLDGPFFEETIYVTPSRHPPQVQRRILAAAEKAVAALGLAEGPVHAELRCNREGAWVIEVAPRSIGGLCSRALAFTGSDGGSLSLEELILRHALGRDVSSVEREARASGVMMIPIPRAGILRRVGGLDAARPAAPGAAGAGAPPPAASPASTRCGSPSPPASRWRRRPRDRATWASCSPAPLVQPPSRRHSGPPTASWRSKSTRSSSRHDRIAPKGTPMSDLNIHLTDAAREKFVEFLEAEEEKGLAIRLEVAGRGPHGFDYRLDVVTPDEAARHEVLDFGAFRMLVDPGSAEHLDGVTIDFVQRGLESGFHFDNPNSVWKDPVARAVQDVLDTRINPSVAGHGGFVSLLDVKDETAYIALGGGCQGCGMADVTLKQGIEVAIKDAVPEIHEVLDTTDHAAGENPFYQPSKGGESPFG